MTHPFNHAAADTFDSRLAAWTPEPGSADSAVYGEADRMTGRAQDLVRNYPIAAGAKRTLIDNVIGAQIKLSSQPDYRLLGQDKAWAHEWGNNWEAQFATWANTTECDITRTQNFLGLTRQALAGAYVNNDHFAIAQWQPRPYTRWSTRLQLIESARVSTPPWLAFRPDIRDGVETDANGAPLAYWILKQHPGDKFLNINVADQTRWTRVPAFTPWGRRRVIHLYDKERSGQTRGKTVFASVMRELKIGWDYLSSELQAAAVNALIAAFLEADLSQEEVAHVFGADDTNSQTADGLDPVSSRWKEISDKWHKRKMEGGMFLTLPVGAKLSGYNPNRPNVAFDPFMEVVTRYIGVGLNMPFELIAKNFSKTNYSSARAALAEAWRFFLSERSSLLEPAWLAPIVELVMEEAVDKGRIIAPDYYSEKYAYTRCRWIFSGRTAIDPYKEARATTEKFGNKTTTLEREFAEQGLDWEEELEQQAREIAKCKQLGIADPYQETPQEAVDPMLDDTESNPLDDDDDEEDNDTSDQDQPDA